MSLTFILAAALLARGATDPIQRGQGLCRFILHDYLLPAQTEAVINRELAKTLTEHQRLFGFIAQPGFQIRIRIFDRFEDYQQFTRTNAATLFAAQHAPSLTNLSGYYSHAGREVVTWRQQQPGYLANNLLHEASHAIMLGHYRIVPPWISEGAATYFSYPNHLQDAHDLGTLKYRWAKLLLWLRAGELPDLETFLDLTDPQWRSWEPVLAYTASWSIFQFLMSTERSQRMLQHLMRDLQSDRRTRIRCASRLQAAYPGGLTRLEQDWHRWIQLGAPKILGPNLEEILARVK